MPGGAKHKTVDKRQLLVERDDSSTPEDTEGHGFEREVEDERQCLTLLQKVMLSAEQFGNEASCNFGDLYCVPTLQTLGMPLKLVSLTGLIGGPSAFFLVIALGWFSDKGSNPHYRKAVAFLLSTGFLVSGLVLIIAANGLHLEDMRNGTGDESNSSTVTAPNPRGREDMTGPDQVSFKAGLGMLGFVLTGIGVTCTHSCINSWVLACSPRAEHTSVLVLRLVMASLGGVSTAALGMVDLGSAVGADLRKGTGLVIQVSVQAGVIVLFIAIGTSVSLLMGRHIHRSYASPASDVIYTAESDLHSDITGNAAVDDIGTAHIAINNGLELSEDERVTGMNTTTEQNITQDKVPESAGREGDLTENNFLTYCYSPTTTHKNYGTGDETQSAATSQNESRPFKSPKQTSLYGPQGNSTHNDSTKHSFSTFTDTTKTPSLRDSVDLPGRTDFEKQPTTLDSADSDKQSSHNGFSLLSEAQKRDGLLCTAASTSQENAQQNGGLLGATVHKSPAVCWVFSRLGLTDFRWRMGLVCLSAYFSVGVICLFGLMSTDYVGKAIYGGDPRAETGSERLLKYQAGVRMAAWGFLVYYCVYMVFNPFHERVLARLGYKGEFVPIHLLMGGLLMLLAVTARLEVYFLLSAVAGLHRACFYSIPFAVTNDIIQSEATGTQGNALPRVGLAMSVVTGMIPLAFTTLYPWVGPLEQVTGVVAVPMWLGAALAGLSALTFLTV